MLLLKISAHELEKVFAWIRCRIHVVYESCRRPQAFYDQTKNIYLAAANNRHEDV